MSFFDVTNNGLSKLYDQESVAATGPADDKLIAGELALAAYAAHDLKPQLSDILMRGFGRISWLERQLLQDDWDWPTFVPVTFDR